MKMQKGIPHEVLNPHLNRATESTGEALGTRQGRKLPKDELNTAVEAVLTLASVAGSVFAPTEEMRLPFSGAGFPN